ncbi:MAG: ferrous iron transport protein B [Corynebacterium sp.]|nr:ferrous iron transport protein B [Corynebacterium sp.]
MTTVALVGSPNAGKTTLFNALTGAHSVMGNWPGTSVETSRGTWASPSGAVDLVDFPGSYSLDPVSPDEALTRAILVEAPVSERPDVVVVVADASALGRSLYLVAQLAEAPQRLVVAVTKRDISERYGQTVDTAALAAAIGAPVVGIDPRRKNGLDELARAVHERMAQEPTTLRPQPSTVPSGVGDTGEQDAAAQRFLWVDSAVSAALFTHRDGDHESAATLTGSQRIDRWVLHPVWGAVIFIAVMFVVFQITTTVAAPLQDGLDALFAGPVSTWALRLLDPLGLPILSGLIVDGVIAGVGMVLTFAPLMALMFLLLAVLEDSGYMARAAVVANRTMRLIGLPGKAFIPLIVGFGCNVPAVASTRVLSHSRHRIATALLIPFTSCSARLTVYVMLATTFFPATAGLVVFAMYLISIALVVATGLLLRTTLWRTMPEEPLIIDLPPYQLPGVKLVASVMWMRLRGFLNTAGGIIVATVVVVFILQSLPTTSGYRFADESLPPEDSAYGAVGEAIAPVFAPAGFDSWSLTSPLITGFVAKEAVISSWAQTYAVQEPDSSRGADVVAQSPLAQAIRDDFTRASGGHPDAAVWAFMLFILAYTPCVATLAAQKREIGWRWTALGMGIQLTTAWVLAVIVFQVLRVFL